jgi:hypothetical protein
VKPQERDELAKHRQLEAINARLTQHDQKVRVTLLLVAPERRLLTVPYCGLCEIRGAVFARATKPKLQRKRAALGFAALNRQIADCRSAANPCAGEWPTICRHHLDCAC